MAFRSVHLSFLSYFNLLSAEDFVCCHSRHFIWCNVFFGKTHCLFDLIYAKNLQNSCVRNFTLHTKGFDIDLDFQGRIIC